VNHDAMEVAVQRRLQCCIRWHFLILYGWHFAGEILAMSKCQKLWAFQLVT